MLKKISIFFCITSTFFGLQPKRIDAPPVIVYAQTQLPHEGILKMTEDGFLYIELPKEYVFDLIAVLLKSKHIVCPPPYFEQGKIGAHITVAMPFEMKAWKGKIPCLGEKVPFSILHLEKVDLQGSVLQSKTVYMLSVESSQIAEIRKKLDLSPKINDYDFHITIGVDCP
jgi:hypothetical protein